MLFLITSMSLMTSLIFHPNNSETGVVEFVKMVISQTVILVVKNYEKNQSERSPLLCFMGEL